MLILSEEFVHDYISYLENGLTKSNNIVKTLIYCKKSSLCNLTKLTQKYGANITSDLDDLLNIISAFDGRAKSIIKKGEEEEYSS
jgi:hypothetical protein